jgi:glycosyltransferase involved in cell wall biosynthesis
LPAAKQYVNALNLNGKVEFMGTLEHAKVRQMLGQADIFLQHSITDTETGDEEGLPVSILEAMAHSLPVVSTLHAGIPEAVQQDNNGYLVEEGDVSGMSKYIVSLATNPSLRRKMGEAGWLIARDCFSWDKERCELSKLLGIS